MNSQSRPPVSPILVLFMGILAVSTAAIFIRFAQGYAPSIVIAFYRLMIASIILGPIVWIRYRHEYSILKTHHWFLGLLSGTFLAIHFATWITSLEYTSVTSSVVIVTTTPLWVALLAPLVLREPIGRSVAIGLGLSLAGGIIVGVSEVCSLTHMGITCPEGQTTVQTNSTFGNLLALAGAITAAGYILIGRTLRSLLSLLPYIFIVYGIAALVLLVLVFSFQAPLTGYPAIAFLWFFLLAIIPQLIGHSSFNYALGYLPASFVSITLLGDPIGAIILAFFILRESPGPLELIGAILIMAGIYKASQKPVPVLEKQPI